MACSEARLAANRVNALKSTGLRTGEGKEASRRNALKHGLTGVGDVIPGEDGDEVGRMAGPLTLKLVGRDASPALRELAGRAATLMARLRRSARHESAAMADRCRAAGGHLGRVEPAPLAAQIPLLGSFFPGTISGRPPRWSMLGPRRKS